MPENKPMDAEQAISLLDQVCAQVSLTRENHQRVLVAVGVLKKALPITEKKLTIKDDGQKDVSDNHKGITEKAAQSG